jgi:hypothetical protein
MAAFDYRKVPLSTFYLVCPQSRLLIVAQGSIRTVGGGGVYGACHNYADEIETSLGDAIRSSLLLFCSGRHAPQLREPQSFSIWRSEYRIEDSSI